MCIWENEDIPPKDAPDQEVPEKIQTLKEQDRCKDLPFHPPHHPDTLGRGPTTRGLTTKQRSAR